MNRWLYINVWVYLNINLVKILPPFSDGKKGATGVEPVQMDSHSIALPLS